MYIDVPIDEILKKFVDNCEEKETIAWTLKPSENAIHIEYRNKVLSWKDYEDIASDIYDNYFDKNNETNVEQIIKYYEVKYNISITMEMEDNFREEYKYFIENNGTKIVKRPVKVIEKQKINFYFDGVENYHTYRWINV